MAARKKISKKISNFHEVLSMCGSPEDAARLVNIGLDQAYRALRAPDGFDELDKANKNKSFYSMSKEQRKSFLTGCILGGIMPRVIFDMDTGLPTSRLVYEPICEASRLKCLEMLAKMEGDFIERRVLGFELPPEKGAVSSTVREKLDEVYSGRKAITFDPLA